MAFPELRMRLLVDKETEKVVFAEAGKEEIDFLFSILSLPLGTVTRLLSEEQGMVGCLGNIYTSIQNLDQTYLQPDQDKDCLLNPTFAPLVPLLLPLDHHDGSHSQTAATPTTAKQLYKCSTHTYAADSSQAHCPACKSRLSVPLTYVQWDMTSSSVMSAGSDGGGGGGGGFVKGVVTYMVMDDLTVSPMSTISSIVLLNKFNIKDVSSLEERLVHLGVDEGLKILKASMECKKVLTNVFVKGMMMRDASAAPTPSASVPAPATASVSNY